jgi:hypothetical protein
MKVERIMNHDVNSPVQQVREPHAPAASNDFRAQHLCAYFLS